MSAVVRGRKGSQDPFWPVGRIGRVMKALGRQSFMPDPMPKRRN